jgi:hypothetical protein
MLLAMAIFFGFGGLSEYTSLGMVVGAIIAGVLMRPAFNEMGVVGEQVTQTIQSVSYGFIGILFFFLGWTQRRPVGLIQGTCFGHPVVSCGNDRETCWCILDGAHEEDNRARGVDHRNRS